MSPSNDTTAFVLVPGSFSPASFFHKVTALLKEKGSAVYETELKSVNDGQGPPVHMFDDAEHIHSVISKLANEGKNVVLGMNSYGGFPGTQSVKGLSRAEREDAGKPGALIHMVYLGSFIPLLGKSVNDTMVGRMPEATQAPTDYLTLDPKKDAEYVFSHLDASGKTHYAGLLKHHSSVSFTEKITYPGYLHIPATYVFCMDDLVIPSELQHQMVEEAIAQGANITTETLNTDHCPMISNPAEIANILIKAAGAERK